MIDIVNGFVCNNCSDVSLAKRLPSGFPLLAVHGPSYVNAGHLFCAEKPWWVHQVKK